MCRVFLYSRVSTSAQTLAQQERTAYEWLNAHNMKVDEIVSDEGVSGGVSYADRNLGKVLLPKTQEGDMIIVSEISRLGRSMFNLSELIHKELKPRKIRLVCVNMGIDLNCAKMTAIDELIISNFSFAAQLEKQLISERTLSALEVKRKQGVKLGGASEAWQESYKNKNENEIKKTAMARGNMKRIRHQQSRDMVAFKMVLKKVFPRYTKSDNPADWQWAFITTKETYRKQILSLMEDYKALDDNLFRNWDFNNAKGFEVQKLRNYLSNFKRSYTN